jgi:hypothetical protein
MAGGHNDQPGQNLPASATRHPNPLTLLLPPLGLAVLAWVVPLAQLASQPSTA